MATGKTHTVTVRIGYHVYKREIPDPNDQDKTMLLNTVAYMGDEIEISDEEFERGEALDAFGDPEAELAARREADAAAGANEFDPATASVEELAEHIRAQDLNVQETVDLAGEDPEVAERVIEAEELVASETDGEPRVTVVDQLERIAE